jgi:hypothetical protein
MNLTTRTIDTLLDLAENKLSDIVPFDREDMREVRALQSCVDELKALKTGAKTSGAPRRGRRRSTPDLRPVEAATA